MSSRRYTIIGALALLLVATVGTFVFAQGDDSDRVYACVNNGSGTIKIVEPGVGCANNDVPLNWSRDGEVNTLSNKQIFEFQGSVWQFDYFDNGPRTVTGSDVVPWQVDGTFTSILIYPYQNDRVSDSEIIFYVNNVQIGPTITYPVGSTTPVNFPVDIHLQAGDFFKVVTKGTEPFPTPTPDPPPTRTPVPYPYPFPRPPSPTPGLTEPDFLSFQVTMIFVFD